MLCLDGQRLDHLEIWSRTKHDWPTKEQTDNYVVLSGDIQLYLYMGALSSHHQRDFPSSREDQVQETNNQAYYIQKVYIGGLHQVSHPRTQQKGRGEERS